MDSPSMEDTLESTYNPVSLPLPHQEPQANAILPKFLPQRILLISKAKILEVVLSSSLSHTAYTIHQHTLSALL